MFAAERVRLRPMVPDGAVVPYEVWSDRKHHLITGHSSFPGQTGNVTPVSSSETAHRRRWIAVSWDCPLEWASFG